METIPHDFNCIVSDKKMICKGSSGYCLHWVCLSFVKESAVPRPSKQAETNGRNCTV